MREGQQEELARVLPRQQRGRFAFSVLDRSSGRGARTEAARAAMTPFVLIVRLVVRYLATRLSTLQSYTRIRRGSSRSRRKGSLSLSLREEVAIADVQTKPISTSTRTTSFLTCPVLASSLLTFAESGGRSGIAIETVGRCSFVLTQVPLTRRSRRV